MKSSLQMLLRWQWLLPFLLLPTLLLPAGPTALTLLALPCLWLLHRRTTGRFLPATPYDTAILLLMTMVLVSLLVTFDIHLSYPKIAGLTLSVALFYAAIAYTRQEPGNLWRLLILFLAAGAVMALISLLVIRWSPPFAILNTPQRWLPAALTTMPATATGTVNPNELAGVLGWLLPLSVAITLGLARPLSPQRPWLLFAAVAITLLGVGLLLATLSRGGLLAFAAALLTMAAIRYRPCRRLLLVATPAVLILARYLNAVERLFATVLPEQIDLAGRLEIWPRALHALGDFPLTGMSMNGFRHAVHVLYPLLRISPDIDIAHAHNHLLQAGLDLGIPGLIAYLALWALSAALLWRCWQQATSPQQRTFIIGLGGSLASGWVFGIFDAIAIGARPGFLWWLLLALIVAVHDDVMRET